MSKQPDLSQYNYGNMSSLVLQTDRSKIPRRDFEPTGEAESLVGRIDQSQMGTRVHREAPKQSTKKSKSQSAADVVERSVRRGATQSSTLPGAGNYQDILEAALDSEGVSYRPKTSETREVFELILGMTHRLLGDQAADVVRSATDTVLDIVKADDLKDFDKKREIEDIVGNVDSETFAMFLNLSKKLTDWGEEDPTGADGEGKREGDFGEEGVAVEFEGEDDEEDEDGQEFEVRDESDSEEEEEKDGEDNRMEDTEELGADDNLILGNTTSTSSKKKASSTSSDVISPHEIDAFYLQRLIVKSYPDPVTSTDLTAKALDVLGSEYNLRDCENSLMELFDYDKFDLVRVLTKNREAVVWCTKLARSGEDEKKDVEVAMREKGVGWILRELSGGRGGKSNGAPTSTLDAMDVDPSSSSSSKPAKALATIAPGSLVAQPRRTVDLNDMIFTEGGHLNSNRKPTLPKGSTKVSFKGYDQIVVKAPKKVEIQDGDLVNIHELPEWCRQAFGTESSRLNPVQSKAYPVAFGTDEPILLCAPTGAGKTNVAVLTILRAIQNFRNEQTGTIDLDSFKIIYVSPMKALVQEQVRTFTKRLSYLGIKVGELTGDSQLTKAQIAETQVIVTTPEKYDVITRKSTETSYTNLVRLIIVDEIHLLHDERGPVLESIISRTIRKAEQTGDPVRMVGLSATLPNYKDVATFLRVDPDVGLFYFDGTYRPCPLQQEFIGVTEKKPIKRFQIMNEVCYEKVLNYAGKEQTLVFVHSRKETAKTAKFIRDMAIEKETITQFVKPEGAVREILIQAAQDASDANLKDLLPFGFGIHHAGMTPVDRADVEELFEKGHIQVLVCTATLAWGVNLPAHTAIIKGTQVYNPEKGRWVELSPQDVLQMLGRAGRPRFDTFGEGIIITNAAELPYYASLMNQQLPIESQFVSRLVDNLNAEIVLGNVRNRDEAVQWLGFTYFYVRMLKEPTLYSVGADYLEGDAALEQKRADIIHTAAVMLEKGNLIKYDRKSGVFTSTELGKIASHYYVTYASMTIYNQHLKPNMGMLELFRVFALSYEFRLIPVRQEEKLELQKLLERVPIPVKEGVDEPTAKTNVLLQAFISQLKLDGYALVSDMVYVQQSAGRILRAMFEICLRRNWAAPTKAALEMCKMVERRMWGSMTPLRQFKNVPADIVRRAERKEFPWYRYFDLSPPELGELIGVQRIGNRNVGQLVHRLVHCFPKLNLEAHVLPLTRSLLKIDLTITPDFQWDDNIHGGSQLFWVTVEDVDGEIILVRDQFLLRKQYVTSDEDKSEHHLTLTVPIHDPVPPNYFISFTSDRWMHAETRLAVSFKHLILPEKFPPHTPLLDLQPLPVSALHNKEFESVYASVQDFNKIQTQVFQALYTTDDNVFIGAPTGSGKTFCAEFALLRLWSKAQPRKAVCIEPFPEMVDLRVGEWSAKFANVQGGKKVLALTGEQAADLRILSKADIVVCTPAQWDNLSRRWKLTVRKAVTEIGLLIADEMQLIGGSVGAAYEVLISRTRFVSSQTGINTRIVGCAVSLANARDLGDWIGASAQNVFNFAPSTRPLPMDIHIQSYDIPHYPSLLLGMAKPAYLAVNDWAGKKPVIAFVPSRKQCKLTANDILTYCLANQEGKKFLNIEEEDLQPHLDRISDPSLQETLAYGIGYYHEALTKSDKRIVERLFESGAIQVLIASKDTAWGIPLTAYMVIIMGVQSFDGRDHRYVDYPVADLLQMMGRACRPTKDTNSRCVLMLQQTRKEFYKKFLSEALPIESQLPAMLHDHFNAEIVAKTIENKQEAVDWCTWTWFYRRMSQNPVYYNLQGTSHRHLSDHLSELVEETLNALVASKCVAIEDEMDTSPLNLGMIAAYYYISNVTVEIFSMSLSERTKLKGLLEIVSSSSEFEDVPIRHHEDLILRRIYDRCPVKLETPDFESPHFKTFILLQAHFSRVNLPADLASDQQVILGKMISLLSACVDVMSSNAYLSALGAMDLSQMCIQAMWETDSPLKQIPHFDSEVIARCKAANVDSVYDITELEDDQRNDLLRMDQRQMRDVARFVNAYPSIEVSYEIVEDADGYNASKPITVRVTLDREADEDAEEEDQSVVAPHYPGKKIPNFWLILATGKTLQGIKKVTVTRELKVKLDVNLPAGDHEMKLYLICDSYLGADQTFDLPKISVAEGEDSDEDDDSDEDMEE